MKRIIIYILSICAIALAFSSCEKKENDLKYYYTGKEYFPLQTGDSLIYKVTEISIDVKMGINDTIKYYMLERIESSFVDNHGDIAYRIEQYNKPLNGTTWNIAKILSEKVTEKTAERVEDNLRIVKLRFPTKLNYKWDGNIYNEYKMPQEQLNTQHGKDSLFCITKIDYRYKNNFIDVDSCIIVSEYCNESLIDKNSVYGVYSKGIGLVYREEMYIKAQDVILGVPAEDRPTIAKIYKQELVRAAIRN